MSTETSRSRRVLPYAITREQRVEAIARRMRDGTWRRGMAADLAAEWDVKLVVAEHAAGEAAMLLRLAKRLFDEDVKAEVVRQFGAFLSA